MKDRLDRQAGRSARFYFANLCADVMRCIVAAEASDTERYRSSLARARTTLAGLHNTRRFEAYEEGLLLLRALEHAREGNTPAYRTGKLGVFRRQVDQLAIRAL